MAAAEAVLSSLISEPGASETPTQPDFRVQLNQEGAPVTATIERIHQSADAAPDAIPETFFFGGLYDPAVQLRRPIPVHTERTAEGVNVVWDEVSEFGNGNTFSEAVEDFGRTIFELYKSLLSDNVVLGGDLVNVRDTLAEYIAVRPK